MKRIFRKLDCIRLLSIAIALSVAGPVRAAMQWGFSAESAAVRFDGRASFGGKLVNGTALLGEADGSAVTPWNTTAETNGWHARTSGTNTTELAVLNNAAIAIEGGRLQSSAIEWASNTTHLVRNWVVVPSGCALTVTAGTVVKFCPETGIKIEDGGKLNVVGADGADVIFTTANDDTAGAVIAETRMQSNGFDGIRLQSGAATFTDNSYFQLRGGTYGAYPAVAINDTTAVRNGGMAYLSLTISGSRNQAFSVDWAAVDGTAKFGADYTLASGTIVWTGTSQGTKTLMIPIVATNVTGETRTFTVKLTTARCATVADGEATVTIVERAAENMEWGESAESAAVRFDGRETFGGKLVNGTMLLGSADGATNTPWNTALRPDGWTNLAEGVALYTMNTNTIVIEGGRLQPTAIEWASNATHLVRNWVVVPSGGTLTVTTNTVVKFCPETGIKVEDGGKLVIAGADGRDVIFTAANDDSVGAVIADPRLQSTAFEGIRLQSGAATFADNGYFQTRGYTYGAYPSVTVNDSVSFRSDGVAYVPLTIGGSRNQAFSVDWVAVDDTAKLGEDYTLASGTAVWTGTSQGTKTLAIPLVKGNLHGAVTSFKVKIITARCVNVADGEGTVEIHELTFLPIKSGESAASAAVRFDSRETFGGKLVNGTALLGEADGSKVTPWNTTAVTNGWYSRMSGTNRADLAVLNSPAIAIEGGRLQSAAIEWDSNTTHLVRNWVVVPAGGTLTVTAGTVVKFCPETGIKIEDGGKLNVVGADGADVIFTAANDDTVGAAISNPRMQSNAFDGIRLQSGAATFTDNGWIQTRGFAGVPGYGTISVHDAVVDRINGKVYVAVTVTGSRDQSFTADWAAVDGTAKFGEDYTLAGGRLTWARTSEGTKWIEIPLKTTMTGERREFMVKLVTTRGIVTAIGTATVEIGEFDTVKVTNPVALFTNNVDSAAFAVDGEIGNEPFFTGKSIDVVYSTKWLARTNAAAAGATVTLMSDAGGLNVLARCGVDEAGTVALNVGALQVGSYTLKHVITDAEGKLLNTLTKVFAVVDPETTILHGGTLTSNETWRAGIVHVVYKDVYVPAAYTLFLEPGAIVKFLTGTGIEIQAGGGALFANGIVFTHINDDTVGGDTLYNGSSVPPAMDSYTLTGNMTIGEDSELRYTVQPPLSGTISTSRMLSRGSVYHVSGNVTVAGGATLTIPQGTILKFDPGVSLTVNSGATLNALGTRAAPIVFTSIKDDANGGDTNGDGDGTTPQPGDWKKIIANGTVNLNNVSILYGAAGTGTDDALLVTGGTVAMNNSIIAHSQMYAIGFESGHCYVSNSIIKDCFCAVRHFLSDPIVNCVIDDCTRLSNNNGQKFANCVITRITDAWDWSNGSGNTYNHCVVYNPVGYALQKSSVNLGSNGNIWGDPLFVDADNGDYRVQDGSPCVDAADGTAAPAEDLFGQPRCTIQGSATNGTPMADGVYADIGVYEVMPRNMTSNIDLSARNVKADAMAKPGNKLFVQWTVGNEGGKTLQGSWRDTVSLVSENGQTVTLGEKVSSGTIVAGGGFNVTGYFDVPAIAEGKWYAKVVVNAYRDVYEGMLTANNALTSANATAVTVETLAAKDGANGTLTQTGTTVLKFTFDGLSNQVANVTVPNGAKVYYGIGFIPTAVSHSGMLTGSGLFGVPFGSGTVYVVIEAGTEDGAYDVTFVEGSLALSGISPTSIPKSGKTSIMITGAGFTTNTVVSFTGTGTVTPLTTRLVSAEEIIATVDCSAFTAGRTYTVRAETASDFATLPNVLNVANVEGVRKLVYNLVVPNPMRMKRKYTAYIEYTNMGTVDEQLPIFIISGQTIELKPVCVCCPWTSQLALVGVGDKIGNSIRPGEKYKVSFLCQTTSFAECAITCHLLDERKGVNINDVCTWMNFDTTDSLLMERVRNLYGLDWNTFATNIRNYLSDNIQCIEEPSSLRNVIDAYLSTNGTPTVTEVTVMVNHGGFNSALQLRMDSLDGNNRKCAEICTGPLVFNGIHSGEWNFSVWLDSTHKIYERIVRIDAINNIVRIDLDPLRIIRGVVYDDKGAVVAGVSLYDIVTGNMFYTDQAGRFEGNICVNNKTVLLVQHDGFVQSQCYLGVEDISTNVTIELKTGRLVSGHLNNDNLNLANVVPLSFYSSSDDSVYSCFSVNGCYQLTLPVGCYTVMAADSQVDTIIVASSAGKSSNTMPPCVSKDVVEGYNTDRMIRALHATANVWRGFEYAGFLGSYSMSKMNLGWYEAGELLDHYLEGSGKTNNLYISSLADAMKVDTSCFSFKRSYNPTVRAEIQDYLKNNVSTREQMQSFKCDSIKGPNFGPRIGINMFSPLYWGIRSTHGLSLSYSNGSYIGTINKGDDYFDTYAVTIHVIVNDIYNFAEKATITPDKSDFGWCAWYLESVGIAKRFDVNFHLDDVFFVEIRREKDRYPEGDIIDGVSISVPRSSDPNEMSGPLGAGNPETQRFVKPGEWMEYTVYFENQTNATAAAQEVRVTNPLSPYLDWSTFELGEVVFNNQIDLNLAGKQTGTSEVTADGTNYHVRTVATLANGVASWYQRMVDPTTENGWPVDEYAGFLPPNDTNHVGEGHVSYRIKVREDAPAYAIITNSASIVFDYNNPIETDPAWWNTVASISGVSMNLDGATTNLDLIAGLPFGELPTPAAREGYTFRGWYTGANGSGAQVTAETLVPEGNFSLYAYWTLNSYLAGIATNDTAFAGKATYQGWLWGEKAVGTQTVKTVLGTVVVKSAKLDKKGVSKISASVTMLGAKLSLKGGGTVADGTCTATLTGKGKSLTVNLRGNRMWGAMDDLTLDGARDVFQTKGDAKQGNLGAYSGVWTASLATGGVDGDGTMAKGFGALSINVGSKGKAKVSGVLADGTKVSANGQLVFLDGANGCAACIPFFGQMYAGKQGGLGGLLWLGTDGRITVDADWGIFWKANVFTALPALVGGRLSAASGTLAFTLGETENVPQYKGADPLVDLLPTSETVTAGSKWALAKAGKVAKDGLSYTGSNPSGLKLTYTSSSGLFKGSFTIYYLAGGKLSKVKAAVNGVVVDGTGYGAAIINKAASLPVTVAD